MARLFPKKSHNVGPLPGFLQTSERSPRDTKKSQNRLSVIEYTEDTFVEKDDVTLEKCLEHIGTPSMTWVQVWGVEDANAMASIGKHFHLHSLVLEDIVTTGQRSKLDIFQDQVFFIVRLLSYDENTKALKDEQVSIVFGPNYLISFLEGKDDTFRAVKERLRTGSRRIRTLSSDYLAYALLDMIVDNYFEVLQKVDENLDSLEEELISQPKPSTLQQIQHAKLDMIILRKAVWPMRDVINRFLRLENPMIGQATQLYLQDVYDHVVQIIDIIEGFRDVVGGMLDIYLSNINIRTNDIMKVLTIVSTIFVPLTFISSLYGMNFVNMPELRVPWAYPLVLFVMATLASGMLLFFRRKKWI